VSAVGVVQAHLHRIDPVNDRLHAVVQLRADAALADAAAADAALLAGEDVGPLHGVPFTAKDWIDSNDLPCAGGMEEFRDRVPKHDATVVARLRAAGAILLGKTKPGLDDAVYPAAATRSIPPGRQAAAVAGGCHHRSGWLAARAGSDSGGSLRWPRIAVASPPSSRRTASSRSPATSPH
jgi:Asp-tRNA(Asn)/Glu-tRNA(Gln) amidotransferase A subunit family amidase